MVKEESEHLIELKGHLNDLENTIKDPKTTTEERKMAFAQQKRIMALHSQLDPIFISHEAKEKLALTTETKELTQARVEKETTETIKRYDDMKKTLEDHRDITTSAAIAALSPEKRQQLAEARTFAGKSGNR